MAKTNDTLLDMACPLCNTKLELKQINLKCAVFICLNLECSYPVNGDCIEVERDLGDMNKSHQKYTIFCNEDSLQPNKEAQRSSKDKSISEQLLLEFNGIKSNFSSEPNLNENESDNLLLLEDVNVNYVNSDVNVDDIDEFLNELIRSN